MYECNLIIHQLDKHDADTSGTLAPALGEHYTTRLPRYARKDILLFNHTNTYIALNNFTSNHHILITMTLPQPNEYAPMQGTYVQAASNRGEIIPLLNTLKDETYQFFMGLPADKADYAYATGKWTIKEVIGHMIDTERVFAYRLMCFARGETKALPGFDQDEYMAGVNFTTRTLKSLADEFKTVREANLYLFNSLTPEQIARRGNASDYSVTVNAMLYVIAGHELHHLRILRERY